MTGLLKNVMTEKADHQAPPALDLDAIVATGNKRIRRRRAVGAAGVAALAAVVATVGVGLVGAVDGPDQGEPPVAHHTTPSPVRTGPFASTNVPSWADRGTIHYGKDEFKVTTGQIRAFVQTNDGFLFINGQREVYFTDGTSTKKIGSRNEHIRLEVSADGKTVIWMEQRDQPTLVIANSDGKIRSQQTVVASRSTDGSHKLGPLGTVAVDGDNVYVGVAPDRLVRVNLPAGESNFVTGVAASAVEAVVHGTFAVLRPDGSTVVSKNPAATSPAYPGHQPQLDRSAATSLSTASGDKVMIYRLSKTQAIPISHPGHQYLFVTQWLDYERFVALAGSPGKPFDLLTCSLTMRNCETSAAAVAPYEEDDAKITFVAPTGETLN
ncbi:hypothetical protein OG394_05355 [Kribbella sp. NBC_01245]|uniref:hypothetical protein n=1 Tax=Kribbella sp. NBC_01245 TaxID=2903578 RepID=UPI002E2D0398|nr:hypothetical protein [Kribbella sp. NBC_01245]